MNNFFFLGFLILIVFSGCTNPESEPDTQFLLRTSHVIVTDSEFSEELAMKIAAYPYDIKENPAEYNKMIISLISSLSEESMILSAAKDKGIAINNSEFNQAEADLKKDYPGDSFEQMLLKNAISYAFWKKRYLKTLIMDKIIDQELKQKIVITPEDIVAFYKKHTLENADGADNKATLLNRINNEKELVSRLRMQKTQDGYDEWIQTIEREYPVEINKEMLKTFLIVNESGSKDK